jgi:hypothetical protein
MKHKETAKFFQHPGDFFFLEQNIHMPNSLGLQELMVWLDPEVIE